MRLNPTTMRAARSTSMHAPEKGDRVAHRIYLCCAIVFELCDAVAEHPIGLRGRLWF